MMSRPLLLLLLELETIVLIQESDQRFDIDVWTRHPIFRNHGLIKSRGVTRNGSRRRRS